MSVIEAVRDLVKRQRLGAVITVVAGPDLGTKAVIDVDEGLVAGELPADVVDDVLADARQLIEHEQNRTLSYGDR